MTTYVILQEFIQNIVLVVTKMMAVRNINGKEMPMRSVMLLLLGSLFSIGCHNEPKPFNVTSMSYILKDKTSAEMTELKDQLKSGERRAPEMTNSLWDPGYNRAITPLSHSGEQLLWWEFLPTGESRFRVRNYSLRDHKVVFIWLRTYPKGVAKEISVPMTKDGLISKEETIKLLQTVTDTPIWISFNSPNQNPGEGISQTVVVAEIEMTEDEIQNARAESENKFRK